MYHSPILSIITWGGLAANILSIIGILNPIIGVLAGISVLITQYFKWKKEKHGINIEYMKEEMERMKLEEYKRKHNRK